MASAVSGEACGLIGGLENFVANQSSAESAGDFRHTVLFHFCPGFLTQECLGRQSHASTFVLGLPFGDPLIVCNHGQLP